MAHVNDGVAGRDAKILRSGVSRVVGKVGRIAELSRVQRAHGEPVRDSITIDVAGHGPVVVTPDDIEVL